MQPSASDLPIKELSGRVIGAAIQVHQALGPGFLESVYEAALAIEFDLQGIRYERQKPVPLTYRGRVIGEHRLDLFVESALVVELKAVKGLEDIFFSITRSYMKAAGVENGLLLNFATMPLTIKTGWTRRQRDLWEISGPLRIPILNSFREFLSSKFIPFLGSK